MAKTTAIKVRCQPELKARLRAQAKNEERSMSSLLHFILKNYLAEQEEKRRGKKP